MTSADRWKSNRSSDTICVVCAEQRARRARVGGRDRINRHDASASANAEGRSAQAVFADRGQRQSERRVRKAARDHEQNEKDREAVERRIALPGEADREQSEHRARSRKLSPSAPPVSQPLRLASSPSMSETPSVTMSRVKSPPRSKQRRGDEADERGNARAKREPEQGVGELLACENGRSVGAKAKKRRVSKRNNSGQSENEVERQSKQAGDERFVDDRRARRQSEDQGQHHEPEDEFRASANARAAANARQRRSMVAVAAGTLIARRRAQTVLADAR